MKAIPTKKKINCNTKHGVGMHDLGDGGGDRMNILMVMQRFVDLSKSCRFITIIKIIEGEPETLFCICYT